MKCHCRGGICELGEVGFPVYVVESIGTQGLLENCLASCRNGDFADGGIGRPNFENEMFGCLVLVFFIVVSLAEEGAVPSSRIPSHLTGR